MKDVLVEEAFEALIAMNGLAYVREGNIIKVMTEAEYTALYGDLYNDKKAIKVLKLKSENYTQISTVLAQIKSAIGKVIIDSSTGTVILIDTPQKIKLMEETIGDLDQKVVTKMFQMKYGEAKDIQAKLSAHLTPGVGHIEFDDRTSKIVVTDFVNKMEKIEDLIDGYDEKSREVLIEAKIAQVVLNNEHQQGINWSFLSSSNDSKLHEVKLMSPFKATASDVLSLSKADSYAAVLQLLNSAGETKILSSPRITTLNGKEAKILVGTKEAYVTLSATTSSSTTLTPTSETVQFIEVGVKLYVTPIINENGFVSMKIRPEVSSVISTITSPMGSKIPIVGTTEAETSVMIKDGVTLVIGGLMKDEKIETRAGIPLLKDIPIIGILFGRKSHEIKKTELIVFLTPHVVTGDKPMDSPSEDLQVAPSEKVFKEKIELEEK